MLNIRETAQKLTTLSPLMINKEKLALEEISNGETVVSINSIDLFELDGEDIAVFTTEEYEDKFSFGGIALKNLINGLLDNLNITIEELNKSLNKEPLEVVFIRSKTKKGHDITKIKIV